MNGITVSLNDRTKRAVCRETVALCAQYSVTVEPALEGAGFLVLHRRHVGSGAPDGRSVYVGGQQVADQTYQWDMNEVYAVVNLSNETDSDGKTYTSGTLDLRYQNLCKDLIQKYGTGVEVPVVFAVYDTVAGGLVGEGEFNVKVVEPYYISENQSLALLKGERGEQGVGIVDARITGTTPNGERILTFTFGGNVTSDESEADAEAAGTEDEGKTTYSFAIPRGKEGVGIVSIAQIADTANGSHQYLITLSDNSTYRFVAPRGPQGPQGLQGPQGIRGPVADGSYVYDPTDHKWHQITVHVNEYGERVPIVGDTGVDERPVLTPPSITASKAGKVLTISITNNVDGEDVTNTFTINDGDDGASPVLSVSQGVGYVELFVNGVSQGKIYNGAAGADGQDGTDSSAEVTQTQPDANGNRTTTITCTTNGTSTSKTIVAPKILVVDAMPASPEAGTLYMIKES